MQGPQGLPGCGSPGSGTETHGVGGCCPHFIRRARSLPWPRCGVWGSTCSLSPAPGPAGSPSSPTPTQTGLVGKHCPGEHLGKKSARSPHGPLLPARLGTALLRPGVLGAPRPRLVRGLAPGWGWGGWGDVLWQRSRAAGSGQLRTVGVCPQHLAVHGHGEGQAQGLRGQQAPGGPLRTAASGPWGSLRQGVPPRPRGTPWARPRPAFPLEWVWPSWALLVSGPRSSRLGPQQLPSTPLSDCDHPSGSVWL